MAVIDTIERDGLLERARKLSGALREGLVHERVREIRGEGLLIGLDLLEAKDYKQRSWALVPLLVLLFLVIAALIAVLIIFVL